MADAKNPPDSADIQSAVRQYFTGLSDYQPGDLIDRTQVAGLLANFRVRGWTVLEPDGLTQRTPDSGEFLVRELRSPQGKAFMRRIGRMPQGYDRLDRLARMPHGEQTVRDLIRGPDGYKMIEYMTGSSGGRQLGRMLSATPSGTNFNQPTGRLYTAENLAGQIKVRGKAD